MFLYGVKVLKIYTGVKTTVHGHSEKMNPCCLCAFSVDVCIGKTPVLHILPKLLVRRRCDVTGGSISVIRRAKTGQCEPGLEVCVCGWGCGMGAEVQVEEGVGGSNKL